MTPFNRNSKRYLDVTTLCLAAALVACGGSVAKHHSTVAPTTSSTTPANVATGVAIDSAVVAAFSEQVDPKTITAKTFIVKQGADAVAGTVSYAGVTATFLPTQTLAPGRSFTATISGAKYRDGTGLASNLVWTFSTAGDRVAQAPVLLGTSANYVILAETAITNVPTSAITGDIAISPAAESYITGFALTDATGYATAPQVVGKVYAADQAAPTPINLTTAVNDMGTAYTDAAGRPTPDFVELATGAIGGMTLSSGLYKWTTGVTIAADVTLTGSATDVWIFQSSGTLIQSAATKVLLSGGAQAKNVFWQVAGGATLGTTSHFEGILLSQTAITLQTGASMNGRALAQTAVALDKNTVTQPAAPADTTPPTITSTNPVSGATGVALSASASATFSKAMASGTFTAATFTLTAGGLPIAGSVSGSGSIATFLPITALPASTLITATVVAGVKDLAGNALAANYSFHFTTSAAPDTDSPAITSTSPASDAIGVQFTASISANFGEPMAPLTITAHNAFTVSSPSGAAVSGSVGYDSQTRVATFQPLTALAAGTLFKATIAGGAAGVKDLDGNGLAQDFIWSFTTAAAPDTTPPTVASTNPVAGETHVGFTASINATFSEAMAPLTIDQTSLTVSAPMGVAVPGWVTYFPDTRTLTFQPNSPFAPNTLFTAKVAGGASGVADLAGNRLVQDFTWTFTTRVQSNLSPVLLGTAGNYVILAETKISNVPTSAITGDIAISPAAESYITGFVLTDATGYATATEVVGKVYAADQAAPTPINLTTAINDMGTAYTDAAGRPTPDFSELNTGAIGGMTLSPGLYKWSSTVSILSDVTLTGSASDVWIFQISGDLTQANGVRVSLTGGALAKNVFWQVAGQVTVGTYGHFEGILLSQTAITLQTGTSMTGRALAQSAVVLGGNAVTQPAQ